MKYIALDKAFYAQDTIHLAKALLGKILVHNSIEGITSGIIVEVEAYKGKLDPASHTFRGETKRNKIMFGEAGHAYIYFTYGMHYCFNVTAGPIGIGEGILIRALEPIEGIDLMKNRRRKSNLKDLCNGPAKLVQAMGIMKNMYGEDLTKGSLIICKNNKSSNYIEIIETTRVGIKEGSDLLFRFYIKNNNFISKK